MERTFPKLYNPAQLREALGSSPLEYLLNPIFPKGALVLLAGDSKAGKSILATSLAFAIARGEPWLGFEAMRGPVLWLAYEEGQRERNWALEHYPDRDTRPIISVWPEDLKIDAPGGIVWLEQTIDRVGPTLVIVDPLVSAVATSDLDHVGSGRACLAGLKDLANKKDLSMLVMHHLRKDRKSGAFDQLAGSHQLGATASAVWHMTSRSVKDGSRTITLRLKGRIIQEQVLTIRSEGVTDFRLLVPASDPMRLPDKPKDRKAPQVSSESVKARIVRLFNDSPLVPRSVSDIAELAGCNRSTAWRVLSRLAESGRLGSLSTGSTILYSLTDSGGKGPTGGLKKAS